MQNENRRALRAGGTFATAAFVSLLAVALVGATTSNTAGGPLHLVALFFVVTVAVAGLVGAVAWAVIVERTDLLPVPYRGGIAGGLTGWLVIPLTLLGYLAINPPSAGYDVEVVVLSLFLGGVTGTIVIGWITIPVGAAVGYWLVRRS